MTYDKFRVRSPVKSFRDLEVYQQTTQLSAEIFSLSFPKRRKNSKDIESEMEKLKEISKMVPRLIVEAYSDKFSDMKLSDRKMEKAASAVNMLVAKLDFLCALTDDEKTRDKLFEILKRYQRIKMRIINLKRAWSRVFGK